MSISNKVENIIIAAITMFVTVAVFGLYTHFFVTKPLMKELKVQRNAIVELAKIPKYAIDNDFGKIKSKDGSSIILDLENNLDAMEIDIPDEARQDSVEKRTFWDKVFFRKNK